MIQQMTTSFVNMTSTFNSCIRVTNEIEQNINSAELDHSIRVLLLVRSALRVIDYYDPEMHLGCEE